ncbi:LysR family transcriptional regulator [Pseudomonas syringae pv. aptata]|nr:LysR family transcriptional regulator [Pseudomonas syringae pv. aptata]
MLADLQGTHLAGRITLGVPDEYAVHVIRDILPVFAAAWPNVVLELKSAPSYALREQVARGKLQAAVIAQPKGQLSADTQFLVSTKPVWVGPASAALASADPLPLAIHAAQCPYREAMLASLKDNGRKTRVVLESPSNQAIKACVEAGLAISLIDRSGVTEAMQILDDLPEIPEHEIVFLRSLSSQNDEAVSLLAQALQKYFRV